MTKLDEYETTEFFKFLYIGNSGAGKTGSLVSLVEAGYKLRVLDMDANLTILRKLIERQCPHLIGNVDVETRRDKFRTTQQGVIIDGTPKAFPDAAKLLDKWSDGTVPKDWGKDTVFVLDSLTRLSDAAFEWAKGMNPYTTKGNEQDPRVWYGTAQDAIEHILALLTSNEFHANVIITSHIRLQTMPDNTIKGFVNSVGQALGPIIPTYFPTLVLAESDGAGNNVKRKIKTLPTGLLDLKTASPFTVLPEYPLETGLAQLVKDLQS